jgi:hypothetical protein
MKRAVKLLGRGLIGLGMAGAVLFALGPYEPVDLAVSFDPSPLSGGVDAYFDAVEAGFRTLHQAPKNG